MKDLEDRLLNVVDVAATCGMIDGNKHKTWVADQMVRILWYSENAYNKSIVESVPDESGREADNG